MAQLGKYELIRKIATGGMAELFLARAAGAKGFEKTLVVKRVLPHLTEEPQFTEMFLSEAMLAARLNHQNIVQIFDFGEFEGTYFIAMEYVDGPNLRTLLKHFDAQKKPLPIPECARMVSLASEALAYAHELRDPDTETPLNLIHRDISPDNILVSRTGGVKVVDFGIAKAAVQSHRTNTGVLKGKVAYMSPEHLLHKPVDSRTDIYALGVVLYELVTARKPYDIEGDVAYAMSALAEPPIPVSTRRPDVPPAIEAIIAKAIAKSPDERYSTCYELQADLEKFLKECPDPVGPLQLAQLAKSVPSTSASLQRSPPVVLATPQPKATPEPRSGAGAPTLAPAAAGAELSPAKTAIWKPPDNVSPQPNAHAAPKLQSSSRRWVRAAIAGGAVSALLLVVALLRSPEGQSGASQPAVPASPSEPGVQHPEPSTSPPLAGPEVTLRKSIKPMLPHTKSSNSEAGNVHEAAGPTGDLRSEPNTVKPPSNPDLKSPAPAMPLISPSIASVSPSPSASRFVNGKPSQRSDKVAAGTVKGGTSGEMTQPSAPTLPAASQVANTSASGPGFLYINCNPSCRVYVDGTDRGEAPLKGLSLPPGSHRVKVWNADNGQQRQFGIYISSGADTTQEVSFVK